MMVWILGRRLSFINLLENEFDGYIIQTFIINYVNLKEKSPGVLE
jgi:hypothetical protein